MYATDQGILNSQFNAAELACRAAEQQARPSTIYRPVLLYNGTQWCAIYDYGVEGFGNTPDKAMADFDKAWHRKI